MSPGCKQQSAMSAQPPVILQPGDSVMVTAATPSVTPTPAPTATPTSSPTISEVPLSPGAKIQTAINNNPPGTVFRLACGSYNFPGVGDTALQPKAGDSFIGAGPTDGVPSFPPCAELNGSYVVTGFTASGSLWKATIPANMVTMYKTTAGSCDDGTDSCKYIQDLFFTPLNDTYLMHGYPIQRTLNWPPKAWEWYLDDTGFHGTSNTVYVGQNPSNFKVEISVVQQAFLVTVNNVTIQNLTIDKFATPNQKGTLADQSVNGNKFVSNWISFNHGEAIKPVESTGDLINSNEVIDNGQGGIMTGNASQLTVTNNKIEKNGYTTVSMGYEAGGTKFAVGSNVTIQNNYAACNKGPGFWTDSGGVNHYYLDNVAEYNFMSGLVYEISSKGDFERNRLYYNGQVSACQCVGPHEPILYYQRKPDNVFVSIDSCTGWESMSPGSVICTGNGNAYDLWDSSSSNDILKDNRVESNCGGIRVTQGGRQQAGPVSVTGNIVIVHGTSVWAPIGFDQSPSFVIRQPALYDYDNYYFDNPSVYTSGKPFSGPVVGNPAAMTSYNFANWQASGQDVHGTAH